MRYVIILIKLLCMYVCMYVCHGQTDRRTDGQTTYCGLTALCEASRGKNGALCR